jgi:hypothetical protein
MRFRAMKWSLDIRNERHLNAGTALLLALAITGALFNGACAKMAEPRPPEIRIPTPGTDLAVRQVSDHVVLTISLPVTNKNGSKPVQLKSIDVYRMPYAPANPSEVPSETEFLKNAVRLASAAPPEQSPYVFRDNFSAGKSEMYAHAYRYGVLFVNRKNQSAGLSNLATVKPIPIPSFPTGIKAAVTQHLIQLTWSAPQENMDGSTPPRNAGYNIYRSEDPGTFPTTPINPKPVAAANYDDSDFRFEATYYYAVATVGSLQQPYPESLPSPIVSVKAKDIFPPAAPADFSAVVQGNTVVLLWEPSASADVAGYRLYRKEVGTENRQLIQSELIRGLSFRDAAMDPAKKYEYEIQAIDAYGNASPSVKTDSEQK